MKKKMFVLGLSLVYSVFFQSLVGMHTEFSGAQLLTGKSADKDVENQDFVVSGFDEWSGYGMVHADGECVGSGVSGGSQNEEKSRRSSSSSPRRKSSINGNYPVVDLGFLEGRDQAGESDVEGLFLDGQDLSMSKARALLSAYKKYLAPIAAVCSVGAVTAIAMHSGDNFAVDNCVALACPEAIHNFEIAMHQRAFFDFDSLYPAVEAAGIVAACAYGCGDNALLSLYAHIEKFHEIGLSITQQLEMRNYCAESEHADLVECQHFTQNEQNSWRGWTPTFLLRYVAFPNARERLFHELRRFQLLSARFRG